MCIFLLWLSTTCVYLLAKVMWIKVLKQAYIFRTDTVILKYFFAFTTQDTDSLIKMTEANYCQSLFSTLSRYNFALLRIHKCTIKEFSLCYWHFLGSFYVPNCTVFTMTSIEEYLLWEVVFLCLYLTSCPFPNDSRIYLYIFPFTFFSKVIVQFQDTPLSSHSCE